MKKTMEYQKPENQSYVHFEIRLSGKAAAIGLGTLGATSGMGFLLKYLIKRKVYKTVYGYIPSGDDCKTSKEQKSPMGFICEPVQSEDSD